MNTFDFSFALANAKKVRLIRKEDVHIKLEPYIRIGAKYVFMKPDGDCITMTIRELKKYIHYKGGSGGLDTLINTPTFKRSGLILWSDEYTLLKQDL